MISTATADRSEFRHILISGTIVGAAIAAAVVVFLLVAWLLPAGVLTSLLLMLIVLAGGTLAAFLPGSFATSRTVQGIASAAAIGLWGTIVFMAIDIILLRPFKALDRKSTRLNSSHVSISYAVFCLKKKKKHKYS